MPQVTTFPNLYYPEKTPQVDIVDNKINQIQILKYMGNKRGLLKWLMPLLDDKLEYGDLFLDLFSGTSSVGYALKPKVRVIANDIQKYSSIISTALLKFDGQIDGEDFEKNLEKHYKEHYSVLMNIFGAAVSHEEKLISKLDVKGYKDFYNEIPKYGEPATKDRYKLNKYSTESFVQNKRLSNKEFPFLLFSIYFPNTFFSLKQCLEIDSLRYAIEQIKNTEKQSVYLSCLMFAMSQSVNSSGHFAEYLNINSDYTFQIIIEKRRASIINYFHSKLNEFRNLYVNKNWDNQVYNLDYKDLLENLYKSGQLQQTKLIYIDTPYTNAQYSRFYHVPETLVEYDYPALTLNPSKSGPSKGRYRNDRYQSKFSQIGAAELAFREMFGIISEKTNSAVAISYSDNSILKPVDKLIEIAKEYYDIIDKKNGHSHSAQGSRFKKSGRGVHQVHEYLLICKHK